MTIPSYLHQTGLPDSVLHVLHVLSGTNQLEALRLAAIYEANVTRMARLEVEKKHREGLAKRAIALRAKEVNASEAKRARQAAEGRAARAAIAEALL